MICDSKLSIDGQPVQNWRFEETLLDSDHWISTALKGSSEFLVVDSSAAPPFEFLKCENILCDLTEFNDAICDENDEWQHFLQKVENKPF